MPHRNQFLVLYMAWHQLYGEDFCDSLNICNSIIAWLSTGALEILIFSCSNRMTILHRTVIALFRKSPEPFSPEQLGAAGLGSSPIFDGLLFTIPKPGLYANPSIFSLCDAE